MARSHFSYFHIWLLFLTALANINTGKAQLSESPWPSFGNDARNTGQSVYVSGNIDTVKWSLKTGGSIESSPVIGPSGTIYVGSDDNGLYAIDKMGNIKWKFDTWGDVVTPAIGHDNKIYAASGDGYLYALNFEGSLIWKYNTGNTIYSAPVIGPDGVIYVGSTDDSLHAVGPNGNKKWTVATEDHIVGNAGVGPQGTVYIGSEDHSLYAVTKDGRIKWKFETGDVIWSTPSISREGTIYIGSFDDHLYAIKPNGEKDWSIDLGSGLAGSPSIGKDGTIYAGTFSNGLYAVKPNGTVKWNFKESEADFSTTAPALDAGNNIYAETRDGRVYALDLNGYKKWQFKINNRDQYFTSSPVIGSNGTVYIGSYDSLLYAFGQKAPTFSEGEQQVSVYKLMQNYPNPFNPVTRISFTIPKPTNIRLSVFSLSGRMLKTLVDERLPPGVHSVKFSAEHLSSGIYFYRLTGDGIRKSKKMILVR